MREIKLIFPKKNLEDYGFILFILGIFFLPSTMLIGFLFLLPAFVIASFSGNKSFFKDYWNLPFLIFGLLILTSAISQNYLLTNKYDTIWNTKLSLIGLANWIPFIWIFGHHSPTLIQSQKKIICVDFGCGYFPSINYWFWSIFFKLDWSISNFKWADYLVPKTNRKSWRIKWII